MEFKQYIQNLIKYTKEHPESLKMKVIYSRDNEGNGFDFVNFKPTMGNFDGYDYDQECEKNIKMLFVLINIKECSSVGRTPSS